MSLVGEIVARFRADTSEYLAKLDAAKAKNRELAEQLVATAGSADKAMATLKAAGQQKALADFGIDPRQVAGIQQQIRAIESEKKKAAQQQNDDGGILGGLKVAATIAIINRVGNELRKITESAKELKRQYDAGTLSAGQMAESLAKEIPIFGKLIESGRNIRELMGFDNAGLWSQVEGSKAIADSYERVVRAVREITDKNQQFREDTQRMRENMEADAVEAVGDPIRAAAMRAKNEYERDKTSLEKDIKKAQEDLKTFDAADVDPKTGRNAHGRLLDATAEYNKAKAAFDMPAARKGWAELAVSEQDVADLKAKMEEASRYEGALAKRRSELLKRIDSDYNKERLEIIEKKYAQETERIASDSLQKEVDAQNKATDQYLINLFKEEEELDKQRKKEADAVAESMKEANAWADMWEKTNAEVEQANIDSVFAAQEEIGKLQEEASKLDLKPKSVWNLPDVKEIRSSTMLLVPPTKVDEKQLEKLGEIHERIKELNEQVKNKGFELVQVSM